MITFKHYLEEAYFGISGGKAKKTTPVALKKKGLKIPREQVLEISDNSGIDTIWCRFDYSEGNLKVGDDTIIFNMGPAADCPSAKAGLCDLYNNKLCYAENSESRFKRTLASRRRQAMQWKSLTAEQLALAIEAIVNGKRKSKKIKYVRFNESGDFYGQDDVEKLAKIADYLANSSITSGLVVYTYTHRRDLDFGPLLSRKNVVIQGSGLLDSGEPFMLSNNFMAYDYAKLVAMMEKDPNTTIPENFTICPGDCSVCNRCKTSKNKIIGIIMHGLKSNLKSEQAYLTKVIQELIKKNGNDVLPDEYIKRLFISQHNNEISFLTKLSKYVKEDKITQKQMNNIFLRRREIAHFMKSSNSNDVSWEAIVPASSIVLKGANISDATIEKAQKLKTTPSSITGTPDQFKIGSTVLKKYPLKDLGGNIRECVYLFPIEEGRQGKSHTPPMTKLASLALTGELKEDPRFIDEAEFKTVLTQLKDDAMIFLSSVFTHGKKMVSKFNTFVKSLFS